MAKNDKQPRRGSFDPSNYGNQPAFVNESPQVGDGGSYQDRNSQRANDGIPDQADGTSEASVYSRRVSRAEYTARRKKSKRRKILVICLIVVAILGLGGAGVAFALHGTIATVEENFSEGIDDSLWKELVKTDLTKEPFYMLLLGTDKSKEREGTAEYEGDSFRSDSIILARIDPIEKKATLVSLHRDILLDIPGYGQNKLNTVYALGGPQLITKTVSELAGVPISHYAEINFDGFTDVVDTLGGIEVDVPMEIDDDDAGGHLDAGPQTLNGEQALILSRARHAYDEFGDGDKYRAANQRLVLGAIAKKILSSDIGTIANTVTELSEHVTTTLSVMDIVGLAQVMQGLDPATDLYSAMTPTEPKFIGDGWYEILDETAWKAMMKRVDQGLPPTEDDVIDVSSGTVLANAGNGAGSEDSSDKANKPVVRSGRVVVKNGTGGSGVAAQAGELVEKLGYTVETGNAETFNYPSTLVIYNKSSQANLAQEIVDALGVGTTLLNDGGYIVDEDFLVVIGADWG